MKYLLLLTVLLFSSLHLAAQTPPPADPTAWLHATATVESNGDPAAIGDDGKALGLYQIHESYWKDAVGHDPTIGGSYRDCLDAKYAEKIVRAYMDRYCRDAFRDGDWEKCSRIHNGGPRIYSKRNSRNKKERAAWDATTKYWNKVSAEMTNPTR